MSLTGGWLGGRKRKLQCPLDAKRFSEKCSVFVLYRKPLPSSDNQDIIAACRPLANSFPTLAITLVILRGKIADTVWRAWRSARTEGGLVYPTRDILVTSQLHGFPMVFNKISSLVSLAMRWCTGYCGTVKIFRVGDPPSADPSL